MGTNTHKHSLQSQPRQSNTEILGNSGSNHGNNGSNCQFSRYTQGTQGNTMRSTYPPRQQEYNQFNDNSHYRDQQRGTQQHAWFDERYNWRYLPPAYPPTPSLNSTFPEALSRSLLQIAENQSRTIDMQ